MGLDMYLNRMPRYEGATATDVNKVDSYIRYMEDVKDPKSKAKEYSMKEWCGVSKDEVSLDMVKFYKGFCKTQYYEWDEEHRYPHNGIIEQVAYWRKANAIHDWFVNNVQDGEDDCEYHDEVTKEILEELLDTCEKVLNASELVDGKIKNGERYENGQWIPCMEDGKYIENPSVAKLLLPTTEGFFFGGTDYDEWYYNKVEYTADKIREILETTDFETQMIYYVSSW